MEGPRVAGRSGAIRRSRARGQRRCARRRLVGDTPKAAAGHFSGPDPTMGPSQRRRAPWPGRSKTFFRGSAPGRTSSRPTGRLAGTSATSPTSATSRPEGRRSANLQAADERLEGLRALLRLSHDLGVLSSGELRHVATIHSEVGRLLGGWMKKTKGSIPP